MNDYTKFSIRVEDATRKQVESFAEVHGMSRNAGVEFLLKYAIDCLQKNAEMDKRFDDMESKLRATYQSLVKQGIYLNLGQPTDEQRNQKAAEIAAQAAQKIFEA